jgi:hypothetical protein
MVWKIEVPLTLKTPIFILVVSLARESIDVMGIIGEVSKVVPLWIISKHGPHGKML